MNYEELLKLIDRIDESNLAYMDYETASHHVVLSKEVPQMHMKHEVTESVQPVIERTFEQEILVSEAEEDETPLEEKGKLVEAPMVGVVYLQPTPDEEAYVKVGDRVEQGDTICIVEAMKLMNEIQAPYSGVVTEILVENEEVVEYNQPLIRIEETEI